MSFMETCYAYVTITPRKGVPIKCVIECCEDGSGDGASVSCSIKEKNLQSIETLDDLIDTLRDNIILDEDDDEYRKCYFTEDNRFVRKLRKEVASLEKVDSIEIVLTKTTSGGNETTIDEINYSFMKKDMDPVLGEDSGTNANNVSNKGQKIKKDDPNINKNKTNADDLNGCWEFSINEDGTLSITEYTGDKTNIIIPREINGKEVTEIGALTIPSEMESKLYKNKSVPALFIPDTIKKIDYFYMNQFYVTVAKDNPDYSDKDGMLFNKNKTVLYACPNYQGEIELPNTLKVIENDVFLESTGITSVTVPEGVAEMGNYVFNDCADLKKIIFRGKFGDVSRSDDCMTCVDEETELYDKDGRFYVFDRNWHR